MGTSDDRLPFAVRKISGDEGALRECLTGRFPGGGEGLRLHRLAALLRCTRGHLGLGGITWRPSLQGTGVVPLALSSGADSRSRRLVLGLPLNLARRLITLGLGRLPGPAERCDEPLTSGEEGVLLYALDCAGGDWRGAGGAPFVIRAILADEDQIADYLEGPPDWGVDGDLVLDGHSAGVRLFGTGPVPAGRGARPDLARCDSWRTAVRISAGISRLPPDGIAALRAGDIVILDAFRLPDARHGPLFPMLSSGRWRRLGRWLDNRRIEVISEMERESEMEIKENEMDEIAGSVKAADATDLEVLVTVEVGEVRMTVAEAAALMPGRILKLDRPVGPDVVLKVGDQIVGRGSLVEYEGVMAVEIGGTS